MATDLLGPRQCEMGPGIVEVAADSRCKAIPRGPSEDDRQIACSTAYQAQGLGSSGVEAR